MIIRANERLISKNGMSIEEITGVYDSRQSYIDECNEMDISVKEQDDIGYVESEEPTFELRDDELALIDRNGYFIGSVSFEEEEGISND